MTRVMEETRGTASLTVEREPWPSQPPYEFYITFRGQWPKLGSAVLLSSFAEEVEVGVPMGGWSTNVAESPLFVGQLLAHGKRPSLWEKLARLRNMIPEEERQRYPADAARNLDKYLYGTSSPE